MLPTVKPLTGFVQLICAFVIIQGSLFNVYIQSHQTESSKQKTHIFKYFKTTTLSKLVNYYYMCSVIVYLLIISKYICLSLLNLEMFEEFKFMHCYLIGRFTYNARTVLSAKYLILAFLMANLFYRLVTYYLRPNYKLHYIDFVVSDFDNVYKLEQRRFKITERFLKYRENFFRVLARFLLYSRYEPFITLHEKKLSDLVMKSSNGNPYPVLTFRHKLKDNFYILRLNRSAGALTLYIFVIVMFVFSGSVIITLLVAVLLYILFPISVTRKGFELNYHYCAQWVSDCLDNNRTSPIYKHKLYGFEDLESVYIPDKTTSSRLKSVLDDVHGLPVFLPVDNLQPMSYYNILRSIFDIMENSFIWLDFFTTFNLLFFNLTMCSCDIIYNCQEINRRLVVFIENQMPKYDQLHLRKLKGLKSDYENDVLTMQALLMDHFSILADYNRYAQLGVSLCSSLWLLYTIIVCGWMSIPGSTKVSVDFYIIEGMITVIVLVSLGGLALARIHNRCLYNTISRVMAHDTSRPGIRARWMTVMGYFFPNPMHCFTLFGTTEISLLFCAKITTWAVSAVVVFISLATETSRRGFYTTHRVEWQYNLDQSKV